ncbi:flagellar hook-length control protein FliK [Rheinheimera sp. YQF-2]|uniref:Flagellar hook-length control protein FliK n=1 Tax=Rheinheimera lutimaris TaxID=2740584 RepID=A0A7Y5EKN2_9GAMM|nr:flagellar hook-length control protein FliK [Rheinheimera lutimaris]NRQ42268.1 flagellar hook-length control protein FliK [Rheinheimera lutimaris]
MNQINPDKLLQPLQGNKPDSPAIKLMLAEVYQSQVQQLTDGRFRLQLPSPQGALHIVLPASASAAVQAMLPAIPVNPQGSLQQLQLQFQPLANGQLQLTLQTAVNTLSIPLSATQVRQLLAISVPGSTTAQATIPARLLPAAAAVTLAAPGFNPVPLSTQTQQALSAMLPLLSGATAQLMLKLDTSTTDLQLRLIAVPAHSNQGNTTGNSVTLQKSEQAAVLQQLVRLFNQQAGTADTTKLNPMLQSALQSVLSAAPAALPAQYKLQLQQQTGQWQLQLSTAPVSSKINVPADDISRPLQFVASPNQSSNEKTPLNASNTSAALQQTAQQAVQQAWRHLLPLLPATADPLAGTADLPEPVQQILQLLRQSQPDGAKVQTPQHITQQLASLLQFQPLQPAATVQSSGGALAAAIQLLLGNLLQRPPALATMPANQRLVQLVNQLEPAQAGNLLRQLAGHSSTLQQSQLATLDSNNAAQQQLLLQLPLQLAGQSVFSQLQVEQREADGKQGGEKQTQWQLTMKFDLQQLGQLLVVAKLQQQQLQLQFYTEQQHAKQLAEQFLPLLKDRCNAQGLEVSQAECVLGKIPDSLLPRANSLLTVKV